MSVFRLSLGLVFVAAAGVATAHKLDMFNTTTPPKAAQAQVTNVAGVNIHRPETVRKATLSKQRDGHYYADAALEGQKTRLMVDTGASVIALTSETAERLRLVSARNSPKVRMSTANGTVEASTARLTRVQIGGIVVSDVQAVIMPPGALRENLLGMSFLGRLKRFEMRSNDLILEQ